MNDETKLIPSGWYFCAESSEIKPGQVVGKKLFGKRLILWRTTSGVLHLSCSICPHLGSDLSKLGQVDGENLRCFSHDYQFNGDGDCVGTWRKNLLPDCHKNVLRHYPLREKNGFVIAWYDEKSRDPSWEMPDALFVTPSKKFVRSNFVFKTSLEVLNEDNFDVGHLYKWHGVHDVRSTPVSVEGPSISIAHAFKRHSIWIDKPLPYPLSFLTQEINSRYSSTLYGHGLTDSLIDIYNFGITLHDSIWCTPIDANTTMYTTFLRLMPPSDERKKLRRAVDCVLRPFIFRASIWRLRNEHKKEGLGFWENQTHSSSPILTEPEKMLIQPYRKWCEQFRN